MRMQIVMLALAAGGDVFLPHDGIVVLSGEAAQRAPAGTNQTAAAARGPGPGAYAGMDGSSAAARSLQEVVSARFMKILRLLQR